jgi:hypothetical protein
MKLDNDMTFLSSGDLVQTKLALYFQINANVDLRIIGNEYFSVTTHTNNAMWNLEQSEVLYDSDKT